MIVGRVNDYFAIEVPILLADMMGRSLHKFNAVVDTGLDHYLMLPREIVVRLGLPSPGSNTLTLGSGQTHRFDQCFAAIFWDGVATGATALISEDKCLAGARSLAGCHLAADMLPGGIATVETLQIT